MIYAQFMYTRTKYEIFKKGFFFLREGLLVGYYGQHN